MAQYDDPEVVIIRSLRALNWVTLNYLSKCLGRPTEGHIPWAIWQKSCDDSSGACAMSIMRAMGYEPFRGYPLHLVGNQRAADDQARFDALQTAEAEIALNTPFPPVEKWELDPSTGIPSNGRV